MIEQLANKVWLLSQRPQARRFNKHIADCGNVQQAILSSIIKRNRNTEYGEQFNFHKVKTYDDYLNEVPVIDDYQQIRPYVDQMLDSNRDVLFRGGALFYETTTGTTSSSKIIPYNEELRRELGAAIAAWMWNLYYFDRKIFSGKAYWSLSPAMKKNSLTGEESLPGISNDTDYFNPFAAFLLKQVMAIPGDIIALENAEEFYCRTWKHLLSDNNLSFISVWSPQFIIYIFNFLKENFSEISIGAGLSPTRRSYILEAIREDRLTLKLIFPNLRLVSCWTSAQSAIWLRELKEICGDIVIQGKGLLSTEGVVTIPYGLEDHILSYTSHFYEFKDAAGAILKADNIVKGETYEVVLTTGAGLYRYNTHDLVRCTGKTGSVPHLQFIGRSGNTSDMVGEKMSEVIVTDIFLEIKSQYASVRGLYLFPNKTDQAAGYVLYIEGECDAMGREISKRVEGKLEENPYYKQGILSGQLQRLSYKVSKPGLTESLSNLYKEQKGIRDGDLKLPTLFPLGFLEKLPVS